MLTESGHQTSYYPRVGPELGGMGGLAGEPAMGLEQAEAMRRTIRRLQSEGLTVVLMIEPGRVADEVDPEMIATYVAWLEQVGEELGVQVWDTYTVGWPSEMYADALHFNRAGATAFTEHVALLLENLGSVE